MPVPSKPRAQRKLSWSESDEPDVVMNDNHLHNLQTLQCSMVLLLKIPDIHYWISDYDGLFR